MIGKRLRQILSERKLTQRELAQILELSPMAISLYISDQRDPTVKDLADICEKLKTTPNYLLGVDMENNTSISYDKNVLIDIFTAIEDWLDENEQTLPNRSKVGLAFSLYDMIIKMPAEQRTATITDLTDFIMKNQKLSA